jgi:hypothetical protein
LKDSTAVAARDRCTDRIERESQERFVRAAGAAYAELSRASMTALERTEQGFEVHSTSAGIPITAGRATDRSAWAEPR